MSSPGIWGCPGKQSKLFPLGKTVTKKGVKHHGKKKGSFKLGVSKKEFFKNFRKSGGGERCGVKKFHCSRSGPGGPAQGGGPCVHRGANREPAWGLAQESRTAGSVQQNAPGVYSSKELFPLVSATTSEKNRENEPVCKEARSQIKRVAARWKRAVRGTEPPRG